VREQVEQRTRTLGIIVRVETPDRGTAALLEGTFCEVQLEGPLRTGQLVVPRAAVQSGAVRVLDGENRLRKREIEIQYPIGEELVVKGAVGVGDRVLLGLPGPVADGSLIDPVTTSMQSEVARHEDSSKEPRL